MNWQESVNFFRFIFAYSDIDVVVYTLECLGLHAMLSEGNPEFYAEDEIERYSENFCFDEKDLETDFTKDTKSCQPPCDEQFPILREKELKNWFIDNYLQNQPKELVDYIEDSDLQYFDNTDQELTILFDMVLDSRDVYPRNKLVVGETRQKFHVTLKPKAELKRQRPSKVPLHLKEKLEKLLIHLKDLDIYREKGDDDKMWALFVNPIILMPKIDYIKLVIDARYLNSATHLTNFSWSLEPVQKIMIKVNGKIFSVSDLTCSYHQAPLSPETLNLTSFIIGGRQHSYTRGFYGPCGLPTFSVNWWQFILTLLSRRSKP